MTIFYFILGAFLRRWYGGCLEDYKILRNRTVQTICMLAVFMSVYVGDWSNWKYIIFAAVVSCWLQFQFWSRGHGACFDIGRNMSPSEDTIRRYNERWYHYPVDWLFDKVLKEPTKKYGFLYDFIYMGLRYTCPMIVMAILDWRYIVLGALVSPIYCICWTLSEREKWIFDKRIPFVSGATNLAERIVGGLIFGGCFALQNGFFWWQ